MKNFLIVLLMIVIVAGTGYGVYYQIDNHNKDNKQTENEVKDNDKVETIEKIEDLDVNSDIVKTLYSYIDILGWLDIFKKNSVQKLEVKDLNQELINYIGYRQIPNSKIQFAMCRDYPNVTSTRICGSAAYAKEGLNGSWDSTDSSTTVIDENDLKTAVENVFGKDSYNRVDNFGISNCSIDKVNDYTGYQYDNDSNKYVYFDGMAGCSGPNVIKTIISAQKINDTIVIIENQKVEQDEYNNIPEESLFNQNVKYIFQSQNGNYYFSSIEKVNE